MQLPKPGIIIEFDVSAKDAAAQREKLFAAAAKSRILSAAPHLPHPGLGHVRSETEGYTLVPMEYRDRYEPRALATASHPDLGLSIAISTGDWRLHLKGREASHGVSDGRVSE